MTAFFLLAIFAFFFVSMGKKETTSNEAPREKNERDMGKPIKYLEEKHTPPEFKKKFFAALQNVDIGVFDPRILYTVASLETGNGTGGIFRKARNLFSITIGGNWKGSYYESASGLKFRIYGKWEDSIKDFVRLMGIGIYKNAYEAARRKDAKQFFVELKKAGYDATSPTYAADLFKKYQEA